MLDSLVRLVLAVVEVVVKAWIVILGLGAAAALAALLWAVLTSY